MSKRWSTCPPRCAPSSITQKFTVAEWLGVEHAVEVSGVAEPAARQQRVPRNHSAALPTRPGKSVNLRVVHRREAPDGVSHHRGFGRGRDFKSPQYAADHEDSP